MALHGMEPVIGLDLFDSVIMFGLYTYQLVVGEHGPDVGESAFVEQAHEFPPVTCESTIARLKIKFGYITLLS